MNSNPASLGLEQFILFPNEARVENNLLYRLKYFMSLMCSIAAVMCFCALESAAPVDFLVLRSDCLTVCVLIGICVSSVCRFFFNGMKCICINDSGHHFFTALETRRVQGSWLKYDLTLAISFLLMTIGTVSGTWPIVLCVAAVLFQVASGVINTFVKKPSTVLEESAGDSNRPANAIHF